MVVAAWMRLVNSPTTPDHHRLAAFLRPYGYDLDRPDPAGSVHLVALIMPGILQYYIDYTTLANRERVWTLLRSWGLPCTLQRLEMKASAVFSMFQDHYVIKDGENQLYAILPIIELFVGDLEVIAKTWPQDELPTHLTLNKNRVHLHTLFNLLAQYDVAKFEELVTTAIGPPPPYTPSSFDRAITIRTLVDELVKEEDDRHAQDWGWLSKSVLEDKLLELNKDFDEDICQVCMDKRVDVLFEPCAHHVCCQDCVGMLGLPLHCVICRVDVVRCKAFFPTPRKPSSPVVRATPNRKNKNCKKKKRRVLAMPTHDVSNSQAIELLISHLDMLDMDDPKNRLTRKSRHLRKAKACF